MPADGIAASCIGVVKIYWTATGEVHALKGIDALFQRGAVTAVVGPSGSGKSSLLRILAGMDRPTAGSVMIGSAEVAGLSDSSLRALRRRTIGYVFQRPSHNLIPYMRVHEQLRNAALIKRASIKGIDELLERLGVGHRRDHLPAQLSGGEQQRVAFAQAIVGKPTLLVADEPTAELDSDSARHLLDTVVALSREGIGIVVSTHDPEVVAAADKTLYLRHGALEAEFKDARSLAVIDAAGRVQIPPEALKLFPDKRAVLTFENGEVRIVPP